MPNQIYQVDKPNPNGPYVETLIDEVVVSGGVADSGKVVVTNSLGKIDTSLVAGGTGTVTSVDIAVPAEFTVTGSPITVSGTITIGKAVESATYVFAGPISGAAVEPTFRALVATDIPALPYLPSSTVVPSNTNAVAHEWLNSYNSATGAFGQTQPAASDLSNGTTGSGSVVLAISPTFSGTVVIPTPFTLGATSVTTTGTQLNYLNAATGTTGTTSTNIVFSTSPSLTTPNIGAATATSIAGITLSITPNIAGGGSVGTTALPFGSVYVGTAATNNQQITSAATTAARVFTLPDANSNPIQPLGSATAGEFVQYIDSSGTQHLGVASSTLAGDTDVSITSPATGQVLTYNGTTSQWNNDPLPISVIQNNGTAVTPSSGVINLIPGTGMTLTTSGDGITFASSGGGGASITTGTSLNPNNATTLVPTFVQAKSGAMSGGSGTLVSTSSVTAGNLLVIFIAGTGTSGIQTNWTVSDSFSSSYSLGNYSTSGGDDMVVRYAIANGTGTCTFTFSGNSSQACGFAEFSNVTSTLDGSYTVTVASGSVGASAAVATTAVNDLIVAALIGAYSGQTLAVNNAGAGGVMATQYSGGSSITGGIGYWIANGSTVGSTVNIQGEATGGGNPYLGYMIWAAFKANTTAAPSVGSSGSYYLSTTTNTLWLSNGSNWGTAPVLGGSNIGPYNFAPTTGAPGQSYTCTDGPYILQWNANIPTPAYAATAYGQPAVIPPVVANWTLYQAAGGVGGSATNFALTQDPGGPINLLNTTTGANTFSIAIKAYPSQPFKLWARLLPFYPPETSTANFSNSFKGLVITSAASTSTPYCMFMMRGSGELAVYYNSGLGGTSYSTMWDISTTYGQIGQLAGWGGTLNLGIEDDGTSLYYVLHNGFRSWVLYKQTNRTSFAGNSMTPAYIGIYNNDDAGAVGTGIQLLSWNLC